MTKQEMEARITDLEEALFEINAHNSNIAHHRARIDIILRGLFSEKEFLTRSQGPGKNRLMAEDVFKMLKDRFKPPSQ